MADRADDQSFTYNADLTPRPVGSEALDALWDTHGAYILRSGYPPSTLPSFYPLYRYEDLYSFSLFPLIAHKGTLVVNRDFERAYLGGASDVAGPDMTIDREVERIGGPPVLESTISELEIFVSSMARAMQADTRRVTDRNPGKTHFVLCGGRDSLNILLLDWTAPVIALSAEPNFPLVQKFVAENDLCMDVRRLEDLDPGPGLAREIAEAGCMVQLENWKWAEHLKQISREMDHQAVFWKGQMADAFLTDYWRSYTSRSSETYKVMRKAYKVLARKARGPMDLLFSGHAITDFQRTIWQRGAVGQGAHLGVLRAICNALFLSVYHGPETTRILHSIDLRKLANTDLRPAIGEALLGRPVRYPAENPAPPISQFRVGLRTVPDYVRAVQSFGVRCT